MNKIKNITKSLENINNSINDFKSISLSEMNSVSLMKRTDTKYIINIRFLSAILEDVKDTYQVLEISNKRIMQYSSLYFDTPEYDFYFDHHRGRNNRVKIRQRQYVDSDLTFLEIKQKNGKGETNKSRIQIPDFETDLSTSSKEFIKEVTNENFELMPSLWNGFKRITLVNLKDNERVTIDLKLNYSIDELAKDYSQLVVIEVKQSRFDRKSTIVKTLKKYGYNPYSISKYCIGIASVYDSMKQNRFKEKLTKINKITA